MKNNLKGIYPALLTPFKNDRVNAEVLRELINYNIQKGVNGFYVGGSTAEAFMLSDAERKQVYEIAADAAVGKVNLIAHIGCISTAQAIEFAKTAKALGYQAISAIAPFYYKFSFEEIKGYYNRVANSVELPMLVYHFPAFSGVNMGVGEISQFLENDKFMGIKFTSNDFFTLEQVKSRFPNKIVYNGFDEMLLSGLSMGADGGIGSTYNFMADKFVKIQKFFSENKIAEAQEVQREANRIITLLCKFGVMQAEKEVLTQLGIDFGECRKPFGALNDEQKAVVAKEIVPFVKEVR